MPDETVNAGTPIEWAQRRQHIYINIRVEDLDEASTKLDIQKDKVTFLGKSGGKEQSVTLILFGEIKPEDSKFAIRGRGVEVVLAKADADGPYWKRLLKDDKKFHWLRVDFDKWQAEDDSDDEGAGGPGGPGAGGFGGMNFEEMMKQMGGLGGAGGGMGGKMPALDELDEEEEEADSDEEKLPELDDATAGKV